jgi:hypothetical protein
MFYLEQASRIFQLVYHAAMPLSTTQLSFADDNDTSLTFRLEYLSLSSSEERQRHLSTIARLKSRCAGLLEVDHESK